MTVNHDKFQAIIVKRNNKMNDSYPLKINQYVINSEIALSFLELKSTISLFFGNHKTIALEENYPPDNGPLDNCPRG